MSTHKKKTFLRNVTLHIMALFIHYIAFNPLHFGVRKAWSYVMGNPTESDHK